MSYQQKKVPSSLADLWVSWDILVNKWNIDCSTNPNYPAATAGDTYIVSVAGKIGWGSGTDVDIKDMIVCKTTAIAGTQAAVGTSWFVLDGDDDLTAQVYGNLVNSATAKATPVDADYVGVMDSAAGNIMKKLSWANIKVTLKTYFDTLYATLAAKDATGGYAGLTLFKLNLKNAANTFTNFFTNATTAARTWTLPDKDGTVAMLDDITSGWYALLATGWVNTTATNATFTADAGTDFITSNAHNLQDWDKVVLTTSGTLPAGLALSTGYFVRDRTDNTFKLCSQPYDTAIDITDTGSWTHTWTNLQGTIKLSFTAKKNLRVVLFSGVPTASSLLRMAVNDDGGLKYGTNMTTGWAASSVNSSLKSWTELAGANGWSAKFMVMDIWNIATQRKQGFFNGQTDNNSAAVAGVIATGSVVFNDTSVQISSITAFLSVAAGMGTWAVMSVYWMD